MLTDLVHRGVLVPERPPYRGLVLTIRGVSTQLTAEQEEMALAWARKQGTAYVSDPVFARNFMRDFSERLGVSPALEVDEVEFAPAVAVLEAERAARERLTGAERRRLAAERKAGRERLREEFGHATVNGELVELGNYQVEPSGIFMGRGQHPLRGRWKEGATQRDITLNLSPSAPVPAGDWCEIVWQPDSLWVARWPDKLTGKVKYVWLSDSAPSKQAREVEKFDKAGTLAARLDRVLAHVREGLGGPDPKRRRIATVCALIDVLNLRVGDEKDPDEADTVGATTLRPEHVNLRPDGTVEFRFLGKDSVLWHKRVALPEPVRANLEQAKAGAQDAETGGRRRRRSSGNDRPQLFPDVSSRSVNEFLSEALPGLTAKVFRTHHATQAVAVSLDAAGVTAGDPEYLKWRAASLANLEAAVVCNHTRQVSGSWEERRGKMQERRRVLKEKVVQCRRRVDDAVATSAGLRREARMKASAACTPEAKAKTRAVYARKRAAAEARLDSARPAFARAEETLHRFEAQSQVATRMRTWNLTTSLKSYIDPRVYYRWGQRVEYDVLEKYYPKTLRKKLGWVRSSDDESPNSATE